MKFNAKVHDLKYFFWETTLRCNLRCRHCGSDCDKDKSIEDLPKEKVLQVFRDIAENYKAEDIMVAVTGGEPLVRRDLFEVLSEINGMGFPWGMVTNGMLVDENIVKKCEDAGMKTVSVSLDGIGETHNWLRNSELSYDRAINALKMLREPCQVQLYSDSAYLINAFKQHWVANWSKNGWINSSKDEVKNKELWQELLQLGKIHEITWIKVKGHSDNEYNNRCDKLATGVIKKNTCR
jgi:ribonuclease HI